MKAGLGFMCVPPSHRPPIESALIFFNRLLGSLDGSSMNMGTFTAPLISAFPHTPRLAIQEFEENDGCATFDKLMLAKVHVIRAGSASKTDLY